MARAPARCATPESAILRAVHATIGALPYVCLWRNNVGVARYPGRTGLARVRYGLVPGSADLVGVLRRADGAGLFLALEVKAPGGRADPAQADFLDLVRRFGGVAGVVRSPAEALAFVQAARRAPSGPGPTP